MENYYMNEAYIEALKGNYNTYKNPLVGAVIVKDNYIIGKGYHKAYGEPHAEINAINNVKDKSEIVGSTMYVTLEPCSHFGKTPPCCNKIVKYGIKKVIIGQLDPNPITSGRGIGFLEKNGIEVILNLNKDKVRSLNTYYNHFYENKRPFITIKYASTLNGKINQTLNTRSIITGNEVFKDSQEERRNHQAILVGSNTIIIDNPYLNIRTDPKPLYPPIKIILDRRGILDLNANIFNSTPTWVFTSNNKYKDIKSNNLTIFYDNCWTIPKVVEKIHKRGIQSILVEGGSKVHNSFLESNLIDRLAIYLAPKLYSGNSLSAVSDLDRVSISKDFKIENILSLGECYKITALPV